MSSPCSPPYTTLLRDFWTENTIVVSRSQLLGQRGSNSIGRRSMKPGFRIEAVVMIMGKPQIKWLFVKSGFVARGTDTKRHLRGCRQIKINWYPRFKLWKWPNKMLQAVTKVLIKHSDYNLIASYRAEVRFVTTGGSVNFLPVVYISQENSIFSCMISTEVLRSLIYLCLLPKNCWNFTGCLISHQNSPIIDI